MNGPKRITIPLSPDEVEALRNFAARELREPRDQARYMLRSGLGLAAGPPGSIALPRNDNGAAMVITPGAAV